MRQYKMEAAKELGINTKESMTRKQAGQIGGQVVKKMVRAYEKGSK
ncbi:MAG: alpha/beta-type small acid-soluble spore protein [Oscillospiraceae bacterium]|nr:alpha/beta-type small acid-soluble spore protein [Oscillospiraceae bacterium]